MKYMKVDNIGRPISFYSKDIHDVIPTEAIEITEEDWQLALKNQGRVAWDSKYHEFVFIEPAIEDVKSSMIISLKDKYIEVCRETDDEYLEALKRTEAGIAREKDNTDKQKALDRYKNATITYEEKKELIKKAKDLKVLEATSVEIE